MALRTEAIDVRVSQRILWFGSEAYPLHNITRTNTLVLTPNRGAAIKKFVTTAVLCVVAAAVLSSAGTFAAVLAFAGALAFIAFKAVKLVEFLNLTLYELVIETAAGSNRGLISANGNEVSDLAVRITDAINNPLAEFQMRVQNFRIGDDINMYGDHNLGKAVR